MSGPNHNQGEGRWLVCESCGAGPFLEKGERVKHWYDYAHLRYHVVDPPEDGVERSWDEPARWWLDKIEAMKAAREFDMAEPS